MTRPHTAALVEDAANRLLAKGLRGRGWQPQPLGFDGLGTPATARVLGRVLLGRDPGDDPDDAPRLSREEWASSRLASRGWRAFLTCPAIGEPFTVRLGAATTTGVTGRDGFVDLDVAGHGLAPGWHDAELEVGPPGATRRARAGVLVVDPAACPFGLVSDIDDTVISTWLPRPLIAAWNTFVQHEGGRRPVPGMAELYAAVLAEHPGAPVVYVSTGAWNTFPTLARFLARQGFPRGPMLLTDWGPTNTGWFRSGQEHKRHSLAALRARLPGTRWLLVGDDGQHDPALYAEFAAAHPDRVAAVAIRQLNPGEQVLAHGTPAPRLDDPDPTGRDAVTGRPDEPVLTVRAPDGAGLLAELRRTGLLPPPPPPAESR